VVSHFKVFHSFVEDCVFFTTEITLVLSHMRGALLKITPKSQDVHNPQDLGAVATYSASVVD
jgi:hypothetical protein